MTENTATPAPSYECDGQPCTRAAFYAAACQPQRSVAVSACAGAGKTWMLVSRIVRALLAGTRPEHILAITFTRRAAAEMRERLYQWLEGWARAPDDATLAAELTARGMAADEAQAAAPALRALYAQLLESGREVQICTFHSWFISLLRGAPLGVVEALGLPASYELIEEDAAAIAALWQPWLRRVVGDEALRADYCALVAAHGAATTRAALEGALARRAEFVLADEVGVVDAAVPDFQEVFPHLAGVDKPSDWLLVRPAGRAMLQEAAQALGQGTPAVQKQGAALAAALAAADWAGVHAALFTQKGEPRKFTDKLQGLAAVHAAQDEVLHLRGAERQRAAHLYHGRITRLLRSMLSEYGRLKRRRGWIDMADVELAAHRLLGSGGQQLSAAVLERIDQCVRHLLIDEFQDTNPLQWQALRAWLESYGGDATRPVLFIVGDAKQSIYRFRRAEPKVFDAAQQFVTDTFAGSVLACQHTRRNARAVLGAVNGAMLAAQAAQEFSGYVAHTGESKEQGAVYKLPLLPRPPKKEADDADELPPWRDSLEQPRQQAEETLLALECRQAARWIAAHIAAGTPSTDLMVLARKHESLGVLQAELRRLDIASEHTQKQHLAEQPAVLDVLALVDALLSPGHNLALAQALKSPLIGWDDGALMALARHAATSGHDSYTQQQDAPLPANVQGNEEILKEEKAPAHRRLPWLYALKTAPIEGAAALHARLMRWQHWLLHLPPHDALQAIFSEKNASGLDARSCTRCWRWLLPRRAGGTSRPGTGCAKPAAPVLQRPRCLPAAPCACSPCTAPRDWKPGMCSCSPPTPSPKTATANPPPCLTGLPTAAAPPPSPLPLVPATSRPACSRCGRKSKPLPHAKNSTSSTLPPRAPRTASPSARRRRLVRSAAHACHQRAHGTRSAARSKQKRSRQRRQPHRPSHALAARARSDQHR